jgi:hypothetical protein
MEPTKHVILFFVDGLGLAPAGPDNPWGYLPTPALHAWLPAGLTSASVGRHGGNCTLTALDTRLGVSGTPQSASGQTALLTGCNAPARLGHHLSGYPNRQLVELLADQGIFVQLTAKGLTATFANAFYDSYWQEHGDKPHSATTEAVLAAGLTLRGQADLQQGNAIYQDITSQILRQRGLDLPKVPPQLAGERLARIARQHHFTLFEFFQTDISAHKCHRARLEQHIANLDAMFGALLAMLDLSNTWFLLCSDHGNSEDLSNALHSENPVPGLSIGANHAAALAWRSITDVTPSIVRWLTA